MFGDVLLGAWSGAGLAWWVLAWRLVKREAAAPPPRPNTSAAPAETLSIFKPLPPLGPRGLRNEAAGVESFIAQLDPDSELLLGVHEADRATVAPFLDAMRRLHPGARLKAIFRAAPDEAPNPKVAWQKFLVPHAEGTIWLWSDADIVAPPGFLSAARAEFARGDAALLTFPYVVRGTVSGPALFDALFVNVEFHPGVLLLRSRGPVDFGLGAGLLFRRDDFMRRVDWGELGAALADDFVLGQRLGPVRIGAVTLATGADVVTWSEALLHYLRWSKTVAWSRPLGAAARIVVLPVLGWLVYVLMHPTRPAAWTGLYAMTQVDLLFAALICRCVGCRWRPHHWLAAEAWTLGRVLVWLACWLPGPVVWRGRIWHGPRCAVDKAREGIDNDSSRNDGLGNPSINRHA